MKCPLTSIGYLASERIDASNKCECGKEECAWWDEDLECCTFVSLGATLKALFNVLNTISHEMPRDEQFRK